MDTCIRAAGESIEDQIVLVHGQAMTACIDLSQNNGTQKLTRIPVVVAISFSVPAEVERPTYWRMSPLIWLGDIAQGNSG
jgi:hypothetical protein